MTAYTAKRDAQRRRDQLAAIHVCKAKLGLDDDTYRDLLERVSATCGVGVRSAADLCPRQRKAVLIELHQLAGGNRWRYPGKPHNFDELPAMITKIEAQLADMKLSWAYADAIAKRMHRVERVAWLRKEAQLRDIVAALDVEQTKRTLGAEVSRMAESLGLTDDDIRARWPGVPKNWRRSVEPLKLVRDWLEAQRDAAP